MSRFVDQLLKSLYFIIHVNVLLINSSDFFEGVAHLFRFFLVLSCYVSLRSEFRVVMFVRYDFRMKRCSVRLYLQLFVGGFMSYLCYLYFFCVYCCPTYIVLCFSSSCVRYVASSLDCPFFTAPLVFSNVYFPRNRDWFLSENVVLVNHGIINGGVFVDFRSLPKMTALRLM